MSTVDVVAAAIVRDGLVLAARRAGPHRHAGGWEFPGGKVEPGESEPDALARECREELGVDVEVGRRLAEQPGDGIRLVLYACSLEAGEPHPIEDHDELRWLPDDRLMDVEWLPVGRAVLPAVAALLREPGRRGRL